MTNLKMNDKLKKFVLKLINELDYSIDNFIVDLVEVTDSNIAKENVLIEFINDNPDIFSNFNQTDFTEKDFIDYVNNNPSKFDINPNEINYPTQYFKRNNSISNAKKMLGKINSQNIMKNYPYTIENLTNSESNDILSRKIDTIPPIKIPNKPHKQDLIKYSGEGKFTFENGAETYLYFEIEQFNDGIIKIFAKATQEYDKVIYEVFKNKIVYCSIEGNLTDESGKISIQNASPIKNGDLIEFNVYSDVEITINDEFDCMEFGLTNFLNDDNFECQLNNNLKIKFEMVKTHNKIEKLLKNKMINRVLTSKLMINSTSDVFEEIEKLTYLLSYANRTKIDIIYEKFYNGEKLSKIKLIPSVFLGYSNNIKLIESKNLKYFLEKTFDNFIDYYEIFSLNIVISIFLQGLTSIYSDIGYVLLEISLETFLSEWEEYCEKNEKPIEISLIAQNKEKLKKIFKQT